MNASLEDRVHSTESHLFIESPAERRLSLKQQERLQRISICLNYKSGTTLCSQGGQAKFVYLIVEGVIRLTRYDEFGHRQILALRVPGDLCGIPHEGSYFDSAETVSPARICHLEWRQVQELSRTEPQLQAFMFDRILCNYRGAQKRIAILGQQDGCQRVTSCILELIMIPEFFNKELSSLILPGNRLDFADYLGTTAESVTRAITKLESLGLIRRISARRIDILDIAGLLVLQRGPERRCHPNRETKKKKRFLDS